MQHRAAVAATGLCSAGGTALCQKAGTCVPEAQRTACTTKRHPFHRGHSTGTSSYVVLDTHHPTTLNPSGSLPVHFTPLPASAVAKLCTTRTCGRTLRHSLSLPSRTAFPASAHIVAMSKSSKEQITELKRPGGYGIHKTNANRNHLAAQNLAASASALPPDIQPQPHPMQQSGILQKLLSAARHGTLW